MRRRLATLTGVESMALLGGVSLGRVGFTSRALPMIRPVSHIVDGDGAIIIRSHESGAIVPWSHASQGVVVAYQADDSHVSGHLGWSVVVTGLARLVTGAGETGRYRQLVPHLAEGQADCFVRIGPELVNGFRLICDDETDGPDRTGETFSGPVALCAHRGRRAEYPHRSIPARGPAREGGPEVSGSSWVPIAIPIVAMIVLAGWLTAVYYADRHPRWRSQITLPPAAGAATPAGPPEENVTATAAEPQDATEAPKPRPDIPRQAPAPDEAGAPSAAASKPAAGS